MQNNHNISIYLDTRRAKSNEKYPVKLRVYTANPRKQKLYPTVFEFSEKEFNQVWIKRERAFKNTTTKMQAIEVKASEVADKLRPFTFEQFERQLYRKVGDGVKLEYQYKLTIDELLKRNQISTASTYDLSQKSIIDFLSNQNNKFSNLTLFDITADWLKNYEYYMTEKGRSLTTISMYLRALRAIYNRAIDEGEIEKEYYPFGKRKYQVPATKNVKKALTKEQLKTLFNAKTESKDQQKAKDFWFFSYACNGMNIKDIALLTFKDIQAGKVEFYRAKTRLTSKGNLKPITTFLNDFAKEIIEKYGNDDRSPENYVFDILVKGLSAQVQQARIKNFTRYINQHLKKLAKSNNLPEEISTYWARHSFATNAVKNGASMEFIRESLGHSDMKTTQNYFAGFDNETKKAFSESLMNF